MTVVQFPSAAEPTKTLHTIPDAQANHERDGQGPPIGTKAWSCIDCDSFAFYATPASWHCYKCHREQRF